MTTLQELKHQYDQLVAQSKEIEKQQIVVVAQIKELGIQEFEAASGLNIGTDGVVTQELVDYVTTHDRQTGAFQVGVYVWVSDPANGETGTLKTGSGRTHSAYPPYALREIPIDLIRGVVNAYKEQWTEAK